MCKETNEKPSPIMTIFRGLPGSGKSTAAAKLGCLVVSPSDMFATRGGEYRWRAEDKAASRFWASSTIALAFSYGVDVAVAGVLPTIESVERYRDPARDAGYEVRVVDLVIPINVSLERNIHGVPLEHIQAMAAAWEPWREID